jgi:hypothetical protein
MTAFPTSRHLDVPAMVIPAIWEQIRRQEACEESGVVYLAGPDAGFITGSIDINGGYPA